MAVKLKKKQQTPKHILAITFLVQRSLNKLEALDLYGDTCLNTTISTLTHKHGFLVIRKLEPHRNRAGGLTHFTRYSLAESHRDKAIRLLARHSTIDYLEG